MELGFQNIIFAKCRLMEEKLQQASQGSGQEVARCLLIELRLFRLSLLSLLPIVRQRLLGIDQLGHQQHCRAFK